MFRRLLCAAVLLAGGTLIPTATASASPGHGDDSAQDWICSTQSPWRCTCYQIQECRDVVFSVDYYWIFPD